MKLVNIPRRGKPVLTALVDNEMFKVLNSMTWYVIQGSDQLYYARSSNYMHRIVMENHLGRPLSSDEEVDHIDGNGLNNQVENLRIVTRSQNQANQRHHRDSSCKFIGVFYNERYKQHWRIKIMKNGKNVHGPRGFDTPEEAASERDILAIKHHGEYTKLNFEDRREEYISKLAEGYDPEFSTRSYTSKHPGVSKQGNKWKANVYIDGEQVYLGMFDTEELAFEARQRALLKQELSLNTRINKERSICN